jgi:hypothetical protein
VITRPAPTALRRGALLAAVLLGASTCACASNQPPKQPPGVPPTAASVTRENPGGDAADPEWAALERLTTEPFAERNDRWQTLSVPLADAGHWRRVRVWSYPTRATFRYGDEHHAVTTLWYTEVVGPDDPDACLKRFTEQALVAAKAFGVIVGEPRFIRTSQDLGHRKLPVVVAVLEGRVDSLLVQDDYVGAVAAYQSWPRTCLVQGFAVVAGKHKGLAEAVRDRWVEEAAPKLFWKADVPPEALTR